MPDLQVICDARSKPIQGAEGYLWIDNDQINAVLKAVAEWDRQHTLTDSPRPGAKMFSAADLFDYPEEVSGRPTTTPATPSRTRTPTASKPTASAPGPNSSTGPPTSWKRAGSPTPTGTTSSAASTAGSAASS